jgi:hypothetical protein
MEWLRELADQLTYGERSEEAIPLYREVLAGPPATAEQTRRARLGLALALSWSGDKEEALAEYEGLLAEDPEDQDALLGRARVMSWLDHQGPAKEAYEQVLERDPDSRSARRSLGRVQSWRGKHRDAERRLSEYLKDHPDDAEAVFLLAQSQDWLGRPDRAQRTLRRHLAQHPDDERARQLLDKIEFRQRPGTRIDHAESHQSNHLRISRTRVKGSFRFNDGRTVVGPVYQFHRYDAPSNDIVDEILVNRPGLHARHRFDDTFEWNGRFFVDVIDSRGGGDDHVKPTFDTWFTAFPNDVLRFDVGAKRRNFDSVKSLTRGVTATYARASMDVVPDEKTRGTARFSWGDYSDGNNRTWWQLDARRRVWNHPRIYAGWQYTGFDFTKLKSNGYFNPNTYHSNMATLRLEGRVGERFRYDLRGAGGWEIENPGRDKAIWNAGSSLAYMFLPGLELEAGYFFFSSRTASDTGFERGTGTLTLRRVW